MSIILVNPPSLYHMPKFEAEGRLAYFELSRRQLGADGFWSLPGEHLGLGSLASSCARNGITVHAVNGQVHYHRTLDQTWQAIRDVADRHGPATLIGFTGPAQVFTENLQLARQAKDRWPDCVTVLGHDFATLNHARILDAHPEFDAVAVGEAEHSFAALAASVLEGRWPAPVPGIATRDAPLRPVPLLDLDELAWPARSDLPAVLAAGLSAAVFTGRGCPYQCTFCTTGATSAQLPAAQRHRHKSLDNVIAEIADLTGRHRIQHLTITDDLFVTKNPESRQRAADFARRMITSKFDLTFMIDCRVDSIDADLFRLLHAAGLRRIFVGVETSSAAPLAVYNKRYTRADGHRDYIHRQLMIPRELGIDVIPGIITYHAHSTLPELAETLDLIDACDIDSSFLFLNRLIAYPGTPLHHQYQQAGLLTVDWPVPQWTFADPQVAAIETAMRAAAAEGRSYPDMRQLFADLIAAATTRPAPVR